MKSWTFIKLFLMYFYCISNDKMNLEYNHLNLFVNSVEIEYLKIVLVEEIFTLKINDVFL